MRDKFSWYASAFIIWMITGFVGMMAMAVQAFENLFAGSDEASTAAAGGEGIVLAACAVGLLCALVPMIVRRDRAADVCADLLAQCSAVFVGGLLAIAVATFSFLMALIGTVFVWLLFAPMLKTCERKWLRHGLPGLACCTAAVPIVLVLL